MTSSLLCIDDDPLQHLLLKSLFAKAIPQLEYLESPTWGEGREMARRHGPSVVLLDQHLSDNVLGLDRLPELRSIAPYASIILLTGDTSPSLLQRARNLHCFGIHLKSMTPDVKLVEVVLCGWRMHNHWADGGIRYMGASVEAPVQ